MRAARSAVTAPNLKPGQQETKPTTAASREGRRHSSESRMRDLAINTIRTLSMDAVERANSGHPGTPMALAPVAYTVWQEFLQFDPEDAAWPNRDRFVLSNGHASMLLYSMLYLTSIKDAHGGPALTLAVAVIRVDSASR